MTPNVKGNLPADTPKETQMTNEATEDKTSTDVAGRVDPLVSCSHTVTRGRDNEKGSWCVNCGIKIFDVDGRECQDCKHFFRGLMNFTGCHKHVMAVLPDMHVTYKIEKGTCWSDS